MSLIFDITGTKTYPLGPNLFSDRKVRKDRPKVRNGSENGPKTYWTVRKAVGDEKYERPLGLVRFGPAWNESHIAYAFTHLRTETNG